MDKAPEDPRDTRVEAGADPVREFEKLVLPRRSAADIEGDPEGSWGLALSGGGIRSATFCLGLVRGLAKNGLLKQFDYLSSVSGGGYLGASLGRLYGNHAKDDPVAANPCTIAEAVQRGVARDDSLWLWWLRYNGRYLTPAGAKDLGYAAASIIRGIVATHLEIGVLLLLLAALVLLPHVLVSVWPPLGTGTLWSQNFVRAMPSVWLWLMLPPLFCGAHQIVAYWYTRERRNARGVLLDSAAAVLGTGVAYWLCQRAATMFHANFITAGSAADPSQMTSAASMILWLGGLAILSLVPLTAWIASILDGMRGRTAVELRLKRTKRLSCCLWTIAAFLVFGMLDWVSWQVTRFFWHENLKSFAYYFTISVTLLIAVGRVVLPALQRRVASAKLPGISAEWGLNALGILVSVVAAVFWTSALSVALFPATHRTTYWEWSTQEIGKIWPIVTGIIVVSLCGVYVLATRRSFDLLNMASLHNFYRARIERAYVSSGNCSGPNARFPKSPLGPVDRQSTMRVAPLTQAMPEDDLQLTHYAPHRHGGPIHLINCCINQSVDDRTGIYNADRKGVALTIGPMGAETGTDFALQDGGSVPSGTLSRWIAVSGAAASTGMGSRTSSGFAALLFMSGLRLGYWMPSLTRTPRDGLSARYRSRFLEWLPKPLAIVAESLARFPGLTSPIWYVSDGGHFDNTAIYPLLKRRSRLIVAADCGADPSYLFADLESLVRKARIDYGANIDFVDADDPAAPPELAPMLGTPETIGPEAGSRCFVLGRIQYSDESTGVLLIVKPRRLDRMPFELVAYADRNVEFPQQSTGDQFFDEAQWEAYHQLGLMAGCSITSDLIVRAKKAVQNATPVASSLNLVEQLAAANETPRLGRRSRAAITIRASVGAGISLSVLIAAWQGIEQFRESQRAADRHYQETSLLLNDRALKDPIQSLLEEHFHAFAAQSDTRGDDRFNRLMQRLNERCTKEKDEERQRCERLHTSLVLAGKPPPFYDYWFVDKQDAYTQQQQRPAEMVDDRLEGESIRAITGTTTSCKEIRLPMGSRRFCGPPTIRWESINASPCGTRPRLFIHIYDEESREAAQILGQAMISTLGFAAAPIENVVATAQRRAQRAPYVWTNHAVVTNQLTTQLCVDKVRALLPENSNVRRLSTGTAGTVEIWLPPRTHTE